VILGLGYSGAVLVAGQLFGGIGGQPPSWAVAGATLATAAMFQPARRRLQTDVVRRFNRRRYDAAATIQTFATRLRQQLDLDALTAELLTVVDHTMEPAQSSLWLRPTPQPSRRNGADLTSHGAVAATDQPPPWGHSSLVTPRAAGRRGVPGGGP
jgi:hypothetical protein